MTILTWILVALVAMLILRDIVFDIIGKEEVSINIPDPAVPKVLSHDGDAVTLGVPFQIINDGKQSALVIDVIVRPQLAFEQYDGVSVHGKAEMEGRPREDDYFEAAVLFAKGDKSGSNVMNIMAQITLTPRKGMTMKKALSGMVDLPIDIVYMFVGRVPCHYEKGRIILTAEQIAEATGTELITD